MSEPVWILMEASLIQICKTVYAFLREANTSVSKHVEYMFALPLSQMHIQFYKFGLAKPPSESKQVQTLI